MHKHENGKKIHKKNTKKKFNSGEFYLRPHIMIGLRQKHDDGMELDPTSYTQFPSIVL